MPSGAYSSTLLLPGASKCSIIDSDTLACRMEDDMNGLISEIQACLKPLGWTRNGEDFNSPSDSGGPEISVGLSQADGYVSLQVSR
jgi:hypothetical protein